MPSFESQPLFWLRKRPKDRYNILQRKLEEGKLSQEEFFELLDLEFQKFLKENPPIEGVFSPQEELKRIRKIENREEKKKALEEFKDKLIRQRKALAKLHRFLERTIFFNPNVPKEELMKIFRKFSENYGFDNLQNQIIENMIEGYYEQRRRVLEIRQKFPDDRDLVYRLTGVRLRPNDKVKIGTGPMTLDIIVNAFNTGRLYERSENPTIEIYRVPTGFASYTVEECPIYYIVINEEGVKKYYGDPEARAIKMHEYQHHKFNLYRGVWGQFTRQYEEKNRLSERLYIEYAMSLIEEKDPEERKKILKDYLRIQQKEALRKAKDEILATLSERSIRALKSVLDLLFFKEDSPYDYLKKERELTNYFDDPILEEMIQEILVKEYREIIERAIDAYAELIEKGKYSQLDANALLYDVPLENWPNMVRRLLEEKRS
jgi:hypothetical protein